MTIPMTMEKVQHKADTDDDALRANTYALLAGLLRNSPDTDLLSVLSNIESTPQQTSGLGLSWQLLKLSAAQVRPDAVNDEFHDLFIGLGHGEVIPYGSWYLTGYLMDRPLARLRYDLSQLGIERQEYISEPEDHIAAVCETMAILINNGSQLSMQQQFYREHVSSWLLRCFSDIEHAPSANFYKAVAHLGQQFIELENRYLDVGND
jgi:TorA maturation chaperone TorD